jgi:signal transduction histidine kinase
VSELVTNALRHGEGLIEVHVAYRAPLLRCEVRDEGANQPRRRQASGAVNGGRGLQLVEGIVQEYGGVWGVSRESARPGKAVYVEMPLPPKPGGTEPALSTPRVVEECHE